MTAVVGDSLFKMISYRALGIWRKGIKPYLSASAESLPPMAQQTAAAKPIISLGTPAPNKARCLAKFQQRLGIS